MRKWHTNKTKPKSGKEIIVIETDGHVYIYETSINGYGNLSVYDGCWDVSWNMKSKYFYKWAYVDELFEKELKEVK